MKKLLHFVTIVALILAGFLPTGKVNAAVTAGSVTSLVTSQLFVKAASGQVPLFSFTLSQTEAETLSSVAITLTNQGSSVATGADFASVNIYKDNGNGSFDSATDLLSGSQTTVNVGTATIVTTGANNAIDGGKFFVTLATSASWSSTAPIDEVKASLATDAIVTSANSPTLSAVMTESIKADTLGPVLTSAVAVNTGGTATKNAGDTVALTFGEATNKPSVTALNIASMLTLNNAHSWLDGVASIGGAAWNVVGTVLTITLSAGTSLPSVALGDTVNLSGSLITDALGNSATGSQTITGSFGEDVTGPAMTSAVAKNTGGTGVLEAGDSVEVSFGEATNKPSITSANIASVFTLSSSHSFLDGAGSIGTAVWSVDGKKLTLTLSAGTSLPTVAVGDTLTIVAGTIKDGVGNNATGSSVITGSFITAPSSDDDEDDDDEEDSRRQCAGGIINGKLYKIGSSPTVYLVAGCRLKPFRGAAVFKARGHKFQDIKVLDTIPSGVEVTDKPALPAAGTLIKGNKTKTVWFVTEDGKRRGFTKAEIFQKLGFTFTSVEVIDETDLETMSVDANIDSDTEHPSGAIFKCSGATVVFKVNSGKKRPFTSAEVFNAKGHQFKHILSVDCGKFTYADGTAIE